MKYRIVYRYVLLVVVVITTFVSCNNDDYKTGADEVSDTVKDGTWKVSYFNYSGEDKTQSYQGCSFTFGDNTIVTATKETTSYTGVWYVSKSTSDDDPNSTKFMIAFGPPEILEDLSKDWKVIENTGTSLKLKDDKNGDLDIDYLYFEKK